MHTNEEPKHGCSFLFTHITSRTMVVITIEAIIVIITIIKQLGIRYPQSWFCSLLFHCFVVLAVYPIDVGSPIL